MPTGVQTDNLARSVSIEQMDSVITQSGQVNGPDVQHLRITMRGGNFLNGSSVHV